MQIMNVKDLTAEQSAIVLSAAAYGLNAFKAGKKRIPCLNSDVMRLVEKHQELANLMFKTWLQAWDDANFLADEPDHNAIERAESERLDHAEEERELVGEDAGL